MERIKYDANLMKTMALFENVARTELKDCFVDKNNIMLFVVDESVISRAIGRNGANVRRLEQLLNRKVKILSYTPNIVQFVRNLLYPLKVHEVKEEEGVITIVDSDTRTKGLIIGKNRQNLDNSLSIIQRYFDDIKEIKVV